MANLLFLSLSLTFLLFSHGCIAQLELQQQGFWKKLQRQQQHRLRAKTSCRVQQLTAREPSYTFEYEAGRTEFWDPNNEEFRCAGIEFVRHVIQPGGLLVPYYTNAPQLVYILQGEGIHGTVIPGCAETYESETSYPRAEEERGRRRNDRHQKLQRIRRGDVLALQQGLTHWAYNDGDTPLISVSILDVASEANQLDLKFRRFFLAGNPEAGRSEGREEERTRERGPGGETRRGEGAEGREKRNIFYGFDEEFIAEAANVDPELIRKLQAREDYRGTIVRAERLRLVLPERGRQERESEEERGREVRYINNGLEETFCSLKIRQNIDHAVKADIYNPRGGHITTLNSQALPILSYLQLSAEKGVLYRNAVITPFWSTNSHSAVYITGGRGRMQVVGNQGKVVFDDEVSQGQLIIVPQNFAVIKKASERGLEWVTFNTNDNVMKSHLAGRLSAIRAMPEEVLMNAYDISRQDARNLKYSREEATLFSPGSRSGGYA